jgi:hypothetical protein
VHIKGFLSLGTAVVVAVALVSAAGARSTASRHIARIDVSTRAAAVHYLRSIKVNPRGLVIQRGARNYAGPKCPGKGWTCTSTEHPVVQVAAAGGKNTFECSSGHCAVVQAADATAAANTAKCVRTTGITQSCSINQVSSSVDNVAIVYMNATKLTGLTQDASQVANIIQQATGGQSVHNGNRACVTQFMRVDTATTAPRGMPVVATLDGHQTLTLNQDSYYGNNKATESANGSSGGSCAPFVDPFGVTHQNISQLQTIKQTATGSARIEQDENTHDQGANLSLDIEQNQNGGGLGPNNTNDAVFYQDNKLTAIANTPVGRVDQTQSTSNGGLLAKVNQFANGLSNADAHQTETQCEDAATGGLTACATASPDTLPFPLTQVQHGPVRKAPGDSRQTGNSGDTITVTQNSQQDSDAGSTQTNVLQGGFHTDGTGSVTQNTDVNGATGSNTQSGQDVSTQRTCSGSTCTNSIFVSGDVFVSVGNGLIQERTPSGALVRTLDTGKGAGALTAGLAFNPAGALYSADFFSPNVTPASDVSRFNPADGSLTSFGSGYNADPESIVFDSSGNAYVGQADGTHNVLKFSPSGTLLATFAPAIEDRGTDWIDLASDGCTLYYTSEGTTVKTFNVCTNSQGPDFATGLPGPGEAFAIKLLPAGGALVADSDSIVRLDSSGTVVQQYGTGESQPPINGKWFSLALDPSGTAFWAGDLFTGHVEKFRLSDGADLADFNTGGPSGDAAGGLAVAP